MKLKDFLTAHFEALRAKAVVRFGEMDERDADEEQRTFRSGFMPARWREILELAETNEDPVRRAEATGCR